MTIGNPMFSELFICAPCRSIDHDLCVKNVQAYNREVLGVMTNFTFTGCACPCKEERKVKKPVVIKV